MLNVLMVLFVQRVQRNQHYVHQAHLVMEIQTILIKTHHVLFVILENIHLLQIQVGVSFVLKVMYALVILHQLLQQMKKSIMVSNVSSDITDQQDHHNNTHALQALILMSTELSV